MGRLADQTAVHTRVLNASKGPAVQSLRVQNERDWYAETAQDVILGHSGIQVLRGEAVDVAADGRAGFAVTTADGRSWNARSVVVAAGTFMRGLTWYGRQSRPEGRQGEPPALHLSSPLLRFGHRLKRFKTGTPPRVRADSVVFEELLCIPADPAPRGFTGQPGPRAVESPTWQTHTTPRTHQLIQENLHESPMFAGDIEGLGPRYCPSIEDKVVRFAHHDRHLLFVEPDGVQTSEVYLQGFSSSLPPHLQDQLVRSLPGFEHAVIQRYAYAVEYDVVESTELTLNLESRLAPGLFFAGQLNGTSGYEEAAAQGLVAGTAAARRSQGLEEITIPRASGYVGVLLDDLVFRGSEEPYRMMTSRVEHRLLSRQDNADERLTPLGAQLGFLSGDEVVRVTEKYARISAARELVASTSLRGVSAETLLRRPETTLEDLEALGLTFNHLDPAERESLTIQVKYAGYIERAQRQLHSESRAGATSLVELDYAAVPALSNEAREKLGHARPSTLEQAARLPGVRHSDVSALLVHLRQRPTFHGKLDGETA